jgi:hypothetical protein
MTRHISPDKLKENLQTNSYVPKTDLQRNVDKKRGFQQGTLFIDIKSSVWFTLGT